jgi:hypothetical protein
MFISSELFQTASSANPNQPYGRMANPPMMFDDNFVLGKRRRTNINDGSAALSHSLWAFPCDLHSTGLTLTTRSRKSKFPMTIKTTNLGEDIHGTSLPSPPLDHEDYGCALDTVERRASTPRYDSPPPVKSRRKTVPIKKTHTVVSIPIPAAIHHTGQLAPCHICKSKPRQKTDLDRYIDCQLCEKRTCAICIRTCHGRCGGRRICSTCSMERGEEGDSHCLECLDKAEDHEMKD